MPPLRPASPDIMYAVVVEQSGTLLLLAQIRRNASGIFLLAPHDPARARLDDGTSWNPHFSYHTSGQRHTKSFNEIVAAPEQRQPLDQNFRGAESLGDLSLQPGVWARSAKVTDASRFGHLLRVPAEALSLTNYYLVSAQLLEPSAALSHVPYKGTLVVEQRFCDLLPCLYLGLWQLNLPDTPR